jgi:copper chaperone CopZ
MKKHKLAAGFIIFVFVLAVASCNGGGKKAEKETQQPEAAAIEVSIGGMTCLGCEQTIQKNVGKIEGVKSVKASFTIGNAIIEYYPGMVDSLKIKEAISGSGYTVKKFITSPQEEITK